MTDANTYYLNDYLSNQDRLEARQDQIDARAVTIFQELKKSLVNDGYEGKNPYKPGWVAYCELNEIDDSCWVLMGELIRDNRPEELGRLIIEQVYKNLMEEAKYQAEESLS